MITWKLPSGAKINPWYYDVSSKLLDLRDRLKSDFKSRKVFWNPEWDVLFERGDPLRSLLSSELIESSVNFRLRVVEENINAILAKYPWRRIDDVRISSPNCLVINFQDGERLEVSPEYCHRHKRVKIRRVTEEDKVSTYSNYKITPTDI